MIVIILLVTISSFFLPSFGNVKSDARETRILEAVFRYQIAHCYSGGEATSYFLSYKDHDPTDTLMARFQANQFVKRGSRAKVLKDQSNVRRVILNVDSINWRGDRKASVSAICVNDPEAASYIYTLRLINRKWIVTHARMVGAS
jgi:hypothetical protein